MPRIGTGLADILCVEEDRVVANDNTVRYQGLRLQIPPDGIGFKVTVRVQEYPDGTLVVFYGPQCLARYQSDGREVEPGGVHPDRRGPPCISGDRPIVAPWAIDMRRSSAQGWKYSRRNAGQVNVLSTILMFHPSMTYSTAAAAAIIPAIIKTITIPIPIAATPMTGSHLRDSSGSATSCIAVTINGVEALSSGLVCT